eukprot:225254-Pyramimonas_sp.AAC.1
MGFSSVACFWTSSSIIVSSVVATSCGAPPKRVRTSSMRLTSGCPATFLALLSFPSLEARREPWGPFNLRSSLAAAT